MVTAKRKANSSNLVAGAHSVIVLLIYICLFNFQQLVSASCISFQGQIGECVKFEECRSAVILSQKGVNPGFCNFEERTVCCTDYGNVGEVERTPSSEDQSRYFQNTPSSEDQSRYFQNTPLGPGTSYTNAKDTFENDFNVQRKKHGVAKSVGNSNHGKKKSNSDIIEEPYRFETPDTYYIDGEVTYRPVGRPAPPNSQNEEGNFLPPGQAKKKSWRDEKTSENDYSFERVTKKPSRGPNRKGANKRPGGNHESNNSRKCVESNTERSEHGGKRLTGNSYNNQNEYENNYEYKRTTPKQSNGGQGSYFSTTRPDYFGGGSENNRPGNGNAHSNPKPNRRPQAPCSSSNHNTNRPAFQESSLTGSNFPSYPQGSRPGNKRPNYPQGSNSEGNRPNYPQGSNSGGNRPNYPQGSNYEGNRPNYPQGSNYEGNRPNYPQGSNYEGNRPNYPQGSNYEGNRPTPRPGSQNRKTISEQKCEEYSKQVTKNITSLPLTTIPDPVTISVTKCITPQQLIVGGENTTLGEFPHMAAIGFRDRNKKQISWNCGGTLISELFVMTAGHCTSTSSGRPVKVRLGEYNLMKNDDGAYPVDYAVVEIITHPEYKPPSKYNDIALLKLSRAVTFFKHIRPACLYSESTFSASKATATGWGRMHYDGGTSEVLQKVVLSIIDNHTCDRLYKVNVKTEVLSRGIVESQICAGELTGGKDTCQGDSGGPLSITSATCIHHIIGITSFGKSCALPNSTGVYTRVSSYVPWIESVVWPTSYN